MAAVEQSFKLEEPAFCLMVCSVLVHSSIFPATYGVRVLNYRFDVDRLR